jgi:predicted nucleic-acid-binding Zn-ribbon protein
MQKKEDGWCGMELSLDRKKKFIEFINQKWKEPQACPICREQTWAIPDNIYELREIKKKELADIKFAPLIEIVCLNCGYTILMNAMVSGIYIEGEAKASNEARCAPSETSIIEK